jgi:Arc/MetJ-type ribon-helix-helix transcriptional regulator
MTSITVRIPDELKKEIDELGEVSEVTRTAIEKEVKRLKMAKAKEAAKKLSTLLASIPDEDILKAVRETRDER